MRNESQTTHVDASRIGLADGGSTPPTSIRLGPTGLAHGKPFHAESNGALSDQRESKGPPQAILYSLTAHLVCGVEWSPGSTSSPQVVRQAHHKWFDKLTTSSSTCSPQVGKVEGLPNKFFPIRRNTSLLPADNKYVNTSNNPHWVYILLCSDASYYIGITDDLNARLTRHNEGDACPYTRNRRPVSLVYSEPHCSMSNARKREIQLKKWSRAKKQALIAGDLSQLKLLSRRRT